MEKGWPIVIVEGSKRNEPLVRYYRENDATGLSNQRLKAVIDNGTIFVIKNSSEDIASLLHLGLCIDIGKFKDEEERELQMSSPNRQIPKKK